MTRSASLATALKRLAAAGGLLGLVAIGATAAPRPANAWWGHGYGWCCGVGVGIYLPPIVVVPPPVRAPAPVYAAPAQRVWIPAHWQNGHWVPAHSA